MKFETKIVRATSGSDPAFGSIAVPIHQTSTYTWENIDAGNEFDYSRWGTPTSRVLEKCLAELEGGVDCVAFASGLAAIQAVFMTLKPGERVLSCDDIYGGTRRLMNDALAGMGIVFDFADMTDASRVAAHLTPETKIVFIETPSNPLLKIADIAAICETAHRHGALVVVDNTFQTPHFQRPIELGADIVIHSLSKFLSGHHDVIGGAVVATDPQLHEQMRWMLKTLGAPLAPFDAYLTIRGIKTLAVRMDRAAENSMKIAEWLEKHPKVTRVIYPGLESHPGREIHLKQSTSPGAMISFELEGGYEAGVRCMERVKVWRLCESLGGCDSLITHPASMTHATVPPDVRAALGITDSLVRLSTGIEHADDLVADLEQAIGDR